MKIVKVEHQIYLNIIPIHILSYAKIVQINEY